MAHEQKCSFCEEFKPIEEFREELDSTTKRKNYYCVSCEKEYSKNYVKKNKDRIYAVNKAWSKTERGKLSKRRSFLKRVYGTTPELIDQLFYAQHGRCCLCGDVLQKKEDLTKGSISKKMCIDHEHNSNTLRGLLCGWCNIGLGHFRDNPEVLDKAAAYVRRHRK